MQDGFITWSNDEDKKEAMAQAAQSVEKYDCVRSDASYQTFIDIEPNISVRPSFSNRDYYSFRPNESPSSKRKAAINDAIKAYENVGIIKNTIDLMGDFAAQGITLHHEDPSVQAFYRKWWDKINGNERSERFLNHLYRSGNVFIYKRYGKITKKTKREMSKANDIKIKRTVISKKNVPLKYDFLNPLTIEVKDEVGGIFADKPSYLLNIPASRKQKSSEESVHNNLKAKTKKVDIPEHKLSTFFYKKDDWDLWALPMINSIMDDIKLLEKMKLADRAALDGAISNIRLWNVGSLDHKLLPNPAMIDKLRNILASNVGGGTMDLVWGPELSFTESNTQIYKFLGEQKYGPIYNSIHAGLGIPPTLTGLATSSGGFTNNFISLKTLIERLEYGRDLLKKFWMEEIDYIAKAMGFETLPEIHFQHMILSDEASEKKLLIELADRDIVSLKTLRERFGELDNVETYRLKEEASKRERGEIPPRANPYHNDIEIDSAYKKIALQGGKIQIDDVTDLKPNPDDVEDDVSVEDDTNDRSGDNGGRPKFKKDQTKRKTKRVLPRSKATTMIWATEAYKKISSILQPIYFEKVQKNNLRELSKSEASELEEIKFKVLCNIIPHSKITQDSISEVFENNPSLQTNRSGLFQEILSDFVAKEHRDPSMDELRQMYVMAYCLDF